jgi:CBS domain-containing protein
MKVREMMKTTLITADADTTLASAIATLAESHVSALPVLDSHGRLIGVLSTTDVLQAEADCASPESRERLFEETLVRDIMTPRPAVIEPDAEIREAAQQMLYLEVHRLFVEDEGRLAGVISQTDIVRAVAVAKV